MMTMKRAPSDSDDDDDLYFDMEFPAHQLSPSPSSRLSVESDGSGGGGGRQSIITSRESLYQRDSRESSASCEGETRIRPSSLFIPGRTARCELFSSLPRSRMQRTPKISLPNYCSVPGTPRNHTWERDTHYLGNATLSGSISSVEEAGAELTPGRSNSRLSLSDISPSRATSFLPRFLRSSFSKLFHRDKAKHVEFSSTMDHHQQQQQLHHQPFSSSPRDIDASSTATSEVSSPAATPQTEDIVQESLAKGLPIIPFAYPTVVLVDKRREEARLASLSLFQGSNSTAGLSMVKSCGCLKNSNSTADSSWHSCCCSWKSADGPGTAVADEEERDRSLRGLVNIAKHEMKEEEASIRKASSVRGYAANNSRALMRRRSSDAAYVRMCLDPTTLGSLYDSGEESSGDHDLSPFMPDLEEIYLPMDCGRMFRRQERT